MKRKKKKRKNIFPFNKRTKILMGKKTDHGFKVMSEEDVVGFEVSMYNAADSTIFM